MADEHQVRRELEVILERLGIEGARITTNSKLDIQAYARRPDLRIMGRRLEKVHVTLQVPRNLTLQELQTLRQVERHGVCMSILHNRSSA
jgi:hypothetical protein